ncbi:MAG TPA: hypothetical protein VKT73_15405 [Xanthobacteraceae bacterium]|nr:hypothetical protein [Xanthobacteraceae bacterium]
MNAIVQQPGFGAVSTRFANRPPENDLAAGVQTGFGIIGYRGKVWSTRYRGEERQLMRADGDGPRNSIEIVIVKASSHVSKIWYEAGYTEGASAAPDCFSTTGLTPEPGAAKKQSPSCASCPKNAWGSRITPSGKQGKACQDSKRLAVVPLDDIRNEMFKGPMLLRVPAGSLQDLATFGQRYQAMGYPYYSIGVRIAFDAKESYPKFEFSAIRPLTDAEADLIIEMQKSPEVARILAEGSEITAPATANPPAGAFEQPPQSAPAPQIQAGPQPQSHGFAPPTATTVAAQQPATNGKSFEDSLDAKLKELMPE